MNNNHKPEFAWSFQTLQSPDEIPEETLQQISLVFADGFGLSSGWNIASIRYALHRSDILGLLLGRNGEIGGYAFYSAPEDEILNSHLLWEDAICIKKYLHGYNFTSRSLFESACRMFTNREFGWIGGRTQNSLVILRYSRMGTIFPFDTMYSSEPGQRIMNFLIKHIKEIKEVERLDFATGICRQVYAEGRLGDYSNHIQGTERFEQSLAEWKFSRENGDALVAIVKLDHPISVSNLTG
jgi:hypothetical protein